MFHKLGENEIIFPVDAKHPSHERDELIKTIREIITEQQPSEIKVPLWWYVFEISIEKISREHNRKLLTIQECKTVARELDPSLSNGALVEALSFFHEHHIFHYDVFPDIVFCSTQVLLDIITELVEYATGVKEGTIRAFKDGEWLEFIERGTLNEKFLAALDKHYTTDIFGPHELLKLFDHLLIAAKYDDTKKYYMPALLKSLPVTELDDKRTRLLKKSSPLVVRFKNDWPYSGVFCCLQVYLMKECKWELSKEENPTQNVVTMRIPEQLFLVSLVDLIKHIEVYVSCTVPLALTHFPFASIRESIHSGIYSACETLRYDGIELTNAFLCPHYDLDSAASALQASIDCHLALVRGTTGFMSCTQKDEDYPLNDQQKQWLKKKIQVSPFRMSLVLKKTSLTTVVKIRH